MTYQQFIDLCMVQGATRDVAEAVFSVARRSPIAVWECPTAIERDQVLSHLSKRAETGVLADLNATHEFNGFTIEVVSSENAF